MEETGSQITTDKSDYRLLLLGTYSCEIDSKSRLQLPKQIWGQLGSQFAVWHGEIGCLCISNLECFSKLISRLVDQHESNLGRRILTEMCFAHASDSATYDSQGRFTISAHLKSLAKIKKYIILKGMVDHVQIWSKEEWEEHQNDPTNYNSERLFRIQMAIKLLSTV